MSHPLIQLTPHAWYLPHDPDQARVQPAIGVIVSEAGTILIDAGNSPQHARHLVDALNASGAPPVSQVIYTHFHWDHIFGAQVFNVPILAHETCRQRVEKYIAQPWSAEYVASMVAKNNRSSYAYKRMGELIHDWAAFEIRPPTDVFSEKKMTFDFAGLPVELEHVGGHHTNDSTVVRVEDVVFLSDCVYPLETKGFDFDMIQRFIDEDHAHYVLGHSAKVDQAGLRAKLDEWRIREGQP
jgi:glyoxylase-like metal-dependent hydrolase (beta-lactamase superfamily II)